MLFFLPACSNRGSFSLEVVTTFFALKLAEPEGIFFTRGNHESKNMNKIYGFEGEVRVSTVFFAHSRPR